MKIASFSRPLAIAVVVGMTFAGVVAKSSPAPKTANVTSNVSDYNGTVPYAIQSDGGGPYQAGGSGVSSYVGGFNGQWDLDLSQSSRWVSIQVGSSLDGTYNARLISRCYTSNGSEISLLTLNTTIASCSLRVNFTASKTNYTLVMSPLYAGTGTATVACNSNNGSLCVDWTISTTNGSGAANLYKVSKSGAESLLGSYTNFFNFRLTNP